jgi:hypothetical protein
MTAVEDTLSTINNQITLQSTQLIAQVGAEAGIDVSNFGPTLAVIVGSAGLLAGAVNAGSYVGRIGTTLKGSGN